MRFLIYCLTLGLAALAVSVPIGHAATLSAAPGEAIPASYQRWVNESLARTYAGTVTVSSVLQPCKAQWGPTVDGCTEWGDGGPVVRVGGPRDSRLFVLFHELGHVFDAAYMTDASRLTFASTNRRGSEAWDVWSNEVVGWPVEPPSELFADAYVYCALDRHPIFRADPNQPGLYYYAGLPFVPELEASVATEWDPLRWQFVNSCALMGREDKGDRRKLVRRHVDLPSP